MTPVQMMTRSLTLRGKLIVAFVLLTLLSIASVGYYADSVARDLINQAAEKDLSKASSQTALQIDSYISGQLDSIRTEAQQPFLRDYLELPAEERLGSQQQINARQILVIFSRKDPVFIKSYALLDSTGVNVLDTAEDRVISNFEGGFDYYEQPFSSGLPFASSVLFQDENAFYVSAAVRNDRGQIIGVLRAKYDAVIIQSILLSILPEKGTGDFLTVIEQDTFVRIADTGGSEHLYTSLKNLSPEEVSTLQSQGLLPPGALEEVVRPSDELVSGIEQLEREPFFTAYSDSIQADALITGIQLETVPWIVIEGRSQSTLSQPVEDQRRATILIAFLILAVAALAGIWLSQVIAQPVVNLTSMAKKIAGGDLQARAEQTTNDEIGTLAGAFNRMADKLRQTLAGLQDELRERKRARDEYQALFDNSPVGIYRSSVDGRMIQANWALTRFNGYESRSEYLESVTDISAEWYVDPERRMVFQRELEKHGHVKNFESEVFRHKTRERVWVTENAHVVRDADGLILYYEGTVEDITPRKRAEISLRQRESILGVVAEAANRFLTTSDWREEIEAVLENLGRTINATHAYVFENHLLDNNQPGASMRFEWTAPDFPTDLGNPKYQDVPLNEEEFESWYAVIAKGTPYIGDVERLSREDMDSLLERGMKALLDVPIYVDGKWWGTIGFDDMANTRVWSNAEVDALLVASNVLGAAIQRQKADALLQEELTHRKQLIAELAAKNAELERFTYTVSHDLKSPLFTIRGFLGYLEQDALSGDRERLRKDSQRIADATDKMQELLNDLLELSRIGRLMNEPQEIRIGELIREVLELLHGQIEERGVTVRVQDNLPLVRGDRQRLSEVMQNLVDNAIKFMGDQPEPRIEIGWEGGDAERGSPVFFVRDNGVGISQEHYERVFGLFNKLDPRSDGTGIGLALVKRIVEFHGGRVWVESEAGSGSTFFFTLSKKEEAKESTV